MNGAGPVREIRGENMIPGEVNWTERSSATPESCPGKEEGNFWEASKILELLGGSQVDGTGMGKGEAERRGIGGRERRLKN